MLATSKFGISSKRIVAQLIVRFIKVHIVLLDPSIDPLNTYMSTNLNKNIWTHTQN